MTRTDCLILAAVAELERNRALLDSVLDADQLGGLAVRLKFNGGGIVRASWLEPETKVTQTHHEIDAQRIKRIN